MLFADLLSLHLVTFWMFFILVHVTFLSSRCMLELKFAIYYRAASLPSRLPMQYLAEESQAFFQHSPHTKSISNSAILRNNYISLLSDLCACVVHCSVKNAAVLCENHCERVTRIWTSASEEEEEEEERKKNILAVWWLSGSVLSRCLLAPLGVFFVMKALEDEQ